MNKTDESSVPSLGIHGNYKDREFMLQLSNCITGPMNMSVVQFYLTLAANLDFLL